MDEGRDGRVGREPRHVGLIVGVLAGLGVAAAGLVLYRGRAAPPPPVASAPVPTIAEAAREPEPEPVPPVAQADARVRERIGDLSSLARWRDWLASEDLARRFVSSVEAVADGQSPRLPLGFLAPQGAFRAQRRNGKLFVDPASFARYDAFAEVIGSLDARLAGKAWRALHPLLDAAFREIGRPGTTLDERVAAAAHRLTAAPVPEGPIALVRPNVAYLFEDPALESLSPAAKHLLRLGPRNQRLVQGKLAEIVHELALPRPMAVAAPARKPGG